MTWPPFVALAALAGVVSLRNARKMIGVATNGGIGSTLIEMQQKFQVRQTYGWLVVLALVGFTLNALFSWAERRLTFWSAQG